MRRTLMRAVALTGLALLLAAPALADFSGKCVGISDGASLLQ